MLLETNNISSQSACCICSSEYFSVTTKFLLNFKTFFYKKFAVQLVSYNLISFCNFISPSLLFYCATGKWLVFFSMFCKDTLYNWQVFWLSNAVCRISRSKCKYVLKKIIYFCLKIFNYIPKSDLNLNLWAPWWWLTTWRES